MQNKEADSLAIAESVRELDVHDRVGALRGIVNATIHPDQAEDGTGNKFKQSIYDGSQKIAAYNIASDKVEVLQSTAEKLSEMAVIDGEGWLQSDLNDFSDQIETTFVDDLAA